METGIMTKRINKSLVVNGSSIVSESDWNAEIEAKHAKLVEFLRSQKLAGVLIRRKKAVALAVTTAIRSRCAASPRVAAPGSRP